MATTYPGTAIEVSALQKGSSKQLFDGIFVTGGITLSQVSVMTGLEPYVIQNWVKRKFVSPPQRRLYSRGQFARIVIINMLRESLQIEKICHLIGVIGGRPEDSSDDLIGDEELYHLYCDMLAERGYRLIESTSVEQAAAKAASAFEGKTPEGKKTLIRILEVMLYAHAASSLRTSAEEILSTLS